MIVVGSCYFLLTLLIPYDPNIDFVFPLTDCRSAAELRREDSLATLTAFVWVAAVFYKMLPPHGHCRNIYFL